MPKGQIKAKRSHKGQKGHIRAKIVKKARPKLSKRKTTKTSSKSNKKDILFHER